MPCPYRYRGGCGKIAEVLRSPAPSRPIQIKICGLCRAEDAWLAAQLGADLLGFVMAQSPRQVTPREARRLHQGLSTPSVGVFVETDLDAVLRDAEAAGVERVQIHGQRSAAWLRDLGQFYPVLQVLGPGERGPASPVGELMLDASQPGSGEPLNWSAIQQDPPAERFWLAGGLSAEIVGRAIAELAPHLIGVDASSRLERYPGAKDPARLAQFIAAVRRESAKLSTELSTG
jgi:phosphoribosylanthranilate isomerase